MSRLPRLGADRRLRYLWLAPALVVPVLAAILLSPLPRSTHRLASGTGLLLGGFALAAACAYQAVRAVERRRRRAWSLAVTAATLGAVGNLLLLLLGPGSGRPVAVVSPADILLLLALAFAVAAVIAYPSTPRRPMELLRMLLDGVVIGGSLLFVASVTVFPRLVGDGDLGSRILPLAVPVIDIVVVTTALLLFLRRTPGDSAFLGLASAGFALFAVSDFAAVILTFEGPFSLGTVVDLGWVAGYFLLATAVLIARHRSPPEAEQPVAGSEVTSTLILSAVFLAAAVLDMSFNRDLIGDASTLLGVVVLLALLGRQSALVLDNERLRTVLQRQVAARSRDLRTVSERSSVLVNSVAEGIYGVNRVGLVTFVNPAAARTLGYEPADLIGAPAHSLFHAPRASGEPFPEEACYITQAIASGAVTTAEEDTYVRADGRRVPVEVTASPTSDEGAVVGAVVVFRDITQRQEVHRLKNEFVSVVSHELRTPLTSIRGALGLLNSGSVGELTPSARRLAELALDNSLRLGRLINDLLEVERIQAGVLPMDVGEHRVRGLVDAAAAQVSLIAQEAGVTLQVESAEGTVLADADRVQQALLNLLDNAIKFSPAGSSVAVGARPLRSFVEFRVSDTGRGIPSDKLEAIFARFEQVDSSDARDRGGVGLGLAISQSIVERLGGRIWAENNPGGGAIFRFTLPRGTSAGPAPGPPPLELDEPKPAPIPVRAH